MKRSAPFDIDLTAITQFFEGGGYSACGVIQETMANAPIAHWSQACTGCTTMLLSTDRDFLPAILFIADARAKV
jgi:hypothetical protein